MQPRLVFRTHYQADEPALLRLLVRKCSSPVQSNYSETLAAKLAREAQRRGKKFNVPAAAYVVDLARGLDILSEQSVWTPKGHLLGLVGEPTDDPWDEQLELDLGERLAFFRIFLEGDGAAILYLARHVLEHGSIPNSDDDWNGLAQLLFLTIYEEYLKLAGTTPDRVALRTEIDRIRRKGYRGKSGSHKLFVHLQTMLRIGLVRRASTSGRRYTAEATQRRRLTVLTEAVPGPDELEQAVRDATLLDTAAQVLDVPLSTEQPEIAGLWSRAVPLYQRIVATGIPLCSLSTLIDAFQIEQATTAGVIHSHAIILEAIEASQREQMKDVRFHVDRRGNPAFIKLSDEFIARHAAKPEAD